MKSISTTPLLLLHGALGSSAQLNPLKIKLLEKFSTVHLLDFSGHGGLPLPAGGFSMADLADDIFNFLEKENMAQADIFGYSMGGYAALKLAERQPSRVRRIATLGTKFDWSPAAAERTAAALDPQKWIEKAPAFAESLAARHAPADWISLVEQTKKMMSGLAAGEAFSENDFQKIGCPVLVLLGELDNMASQAESENTATLLPAGQFSLLAGVKHPLEQVDLDLLLEQLTAFFEKI